MRCLKETPVLGVILFLLAMVFRALLDSVQRYRRKQGPLEKK